MAAGDGRDDGHAEVTRAGMRRNEPAIFRVCCCFCLEEIESRFGSVLSIIEFDPFDAPNLKSSNHLVCPPNTNFLLNNGEFHILFSGCCVGLFESNGQCTGLDAKQDPFLSLIYKLLRPEDSKNGTRRIPIPD